MEYTTERVVGKGAYGSVMAAHACDGSERNVAIKQVSCATVHTHEAKRILREVQLLRQLHHENIVPLLDVQLRGCQCRMCTLAQQHENCKPVPLHSCMAPKLDVLLVYELLDADLHTIIRSKQQLHESHAQFFIYQALRAVTYLHSAGVLHRDLKPANMLVNANCDLKLCDFGLSRVHYQQRAFSNAGAHSVQGASNVSGSSACSGASPGRSSMHGCNGMTEYVVTRWYRAPELLLNCSEYGPAIDVWSIGCVLAEVLLRTPLLPGRNHKEQLELITRLTGTPKSRSELWFVPTESARGFVTCLPVHERADFSNVFQSASTNAIDLMNRMLTFDPSERISTTDALAHPFFTGFHDPDDEPLANTIAVVNDHVSSPKEAASKLQHEASMFKMHTQGTSDSCCIDESVEHVQSSARKDEWPGSDQSQQHQQQQQRHPQQMHAVDDGDEKSSLFHDNVDNLTNKEYELAGARTDDTRTAPSSSAEMTDAGVSMEGVANPSSSKHRCRRNRKHDKALSPMEGQQTQRKGKQHRPKNTQSSTAQTSAPQTRPKQDLGLRKYHRV